MELYILQNECTSVSQQVDKNQFKFNEASNRWVFETGHMEPYTVMQLIKVLNVPECLTMPKPQMVRADPGS